MVAELGFYSIHRAKPFKDGASIKIDRDNNAIELVTFEKVVRLLPIRRRRLYM